MNKNVEKKSFSFRDLMTKSVWFKGFVIQSFFVKRVYDEKCFDCDEMYLV